MSLSQGQRVWTAFFDESDWAEVDILELRETEALVRQTGTQRSEWVPLSRVFDAPPADTTP